MSWNTKKKYSIFRISATLFFAYYGDMWSLWEKLGDDEKRMVNLVAEFFSEFKSPAEFFVRQNFCRTEYFYIETRVFYSENLDVNL